ncbi:hypothetical protein [Cyanobacterium aponinum]|uniref:Uncharacterized protein n=1 Tax=Cyanobacterium aponinum 0216 TaxID=2676140 RepID=A0A844GXU3_9CHRO|nr:hypothetical protein [Cyanobacterium aponinum]MTF39788.1 hypothetical protein [Cyanobacterium aponinum 0216]
MISFFTLIGVGLYLILLQSVAQNFHFLITEKIEKSTIDNTDLNNNYCVSDVQYHTLTTCIVK